MTSQTVSHYDENFSFKLQIEPLHKLLRDPKKLVLYDGGHSPPLEVAVPVVNSFLDQTWGRSRTID